jgi:hypothetical protein
MGKKKLSLKKEVISTFENAEMDRMRGGTGTTTSQWLSIVKPCVTTLTEPPVDKFTVGELSCNTNCDTLYPLSNTVCVGCYNTDNCFIVVETNDCISQYCDW